MLQRLGKVPPRLGELTGTRLKLLLKLARVGLELLFRRGLRFLRPAEMTHAGHPQAEDPPIRKHTTPGPLLCEAVHAAGRPLTPGPIQNISGVAQGPADRSVIPCVRFVGTKWGEHAPMSDMRRRHFILV